MKINADTLNAILPFASEYGFFGFAFIIFCIFGMRHVPPIITAIGKIINERHKTNLSHKRSMAKIENQMRSDTTDN